MAPSQRLIAVDCCRGIAAVLVLLFHCAEMGKQAKYLGVDPFDGMLRFGQTGSTSSSSSAVL